MIYSNEKIRRQDRLLEEKRAVALLLTSEYGVLSMIDEKAKVYSVPINYVWDQKTSIYFHCAPEGKKISCIDSCSAVSFCIVGKTNVISHRFTTEYESILLECVAARNLSDEEKIKALDLILDKYSPDDKIIGRKYTEKSFSRTEIVKLDIQLWSGKCKRVTA